MGIYWTGEEYPQERGSSRPSREALSSETFSAISRARGSRPESGRCEAAHLRTRVEQFRRRVEDELNGCAARCAKGGNRPRREAENDVAARCAKGGNRPRREAKNEPSEIDAYRSVLLWLNAALNGPVVPSIMLDEEEALYERK